ncbi:nif11-like leader peptide domain protein [Synechococcus sp. BIOS-E4-1]|uniref:Nif11-like leader peptide family natural product precursor n=1 Tax=Synechococcus sp. BIOS-E4-1 TaxID=1400864 RepID=UPI0016487A2C|nr:Nif11-like leader peptide family natural product precursor [Synechococcus sp. BIOS-E4-1]QNI54556.1 nif11-like leader peptide domain protein [Synechococcus sp. BIOS-E4-1]
MSNDQLMAFMEKALADKGLQSRLKDAGSPQAVAEIAKELGYSVPVDDLYAGDSLSAEELEGVAGGGGAGRSCSVGCACKVSWDIEFGYPQK